MHVLGALMLTALRFAWPSHAEARVELTDERTGSRGWRKA
jgi:hypothetical protein